MLADVELDVTVELGRRRMPLADILRLTSGSVVELEKLVGEPLQVFANNRLIAEGEAVVIDDQFGVRITSLASRIAEKRLA
jgi:flagellar motor switch protein FliN/FliY